MSRILCAFLLCFAFQAFASKPVDPEILQALAPYVNLDDYREFRVQSTGGHNVIFMISKKYHHFDIVSVDFSASGKVLNVNLNYQLEASERVPQITPVCPDPSVEFISFAPNDFDVEQDAAIEVAKAAEAKGLKTVRLLKSAATHDAYLNYMTCPKLKGNFYDGDADTSEMLTADGTISATELHALNGAMRLKVTNIWLACQAFNNPMLDSVVDGARAQKYAAGINDLLVGPSDQAAACAMKAAIAGQPIEASFQDCYRRFDTTDDHWGFKGNGSDFFGQ